MEEMKKKHEVYPQSVLSLLLFHNARLQEKINYCVSICSLQTCLTNSINSTHLIFSFLLKSMVFFYYLNHFSQFFAQSPTTLFLLLVEFSYIF